MKQIDITKAYNKLTQQERDRLTDYILKYNLSGSAAEQALINYLKEQSK